MKEIKLLAVLGDEAVAHAGPEDLYKRTYDENGKINGKVVKILGPVKAPYGVIKLKSKPSEGGKIYLKE